MKNKIWATATIRTPYDESFCVAFFRKAWWRVNVFLLSSISDATLMLDFCEVQHLKLNLSAALGRSSQRAKLSLRRFFGSFFAATCSKKERIAFVQRKKTRGDQNFGFTEIFAPVLLGCYVRKSIPYFSLTPLAQRKVPKETPSIFRACGRDSGRCPKPPQTFEKV